MTRNNILIFVAISAIMIGAWAMINTPQVEPPWPERVQGFSFSPMGADHDPIKQKLPTVEDIDKDLALLENRTHAVRTYMVESTMGEIPRLAASRGINVALGAWISDDLSRNQLEVERLIKLARNHRNIVRLIVGNEVLLRKEQDVQELIRYIDQVKKKVWVPVSTAEPWHVWADHPELVEHVDYLAVHMLPYWEGIKLENSVDFIVDRMKYLQQLYPDKPIVIAEVGWPSNGRTVKEAIASKANEATFLRRFLDRAAEEKYVYYIMEAFDQPWKQQIERGVGAYWGVYDVERNPKFEFSAPVVPIPHWQLLAGISALVAIITFTLFLLDGRSLNNRGRGFLAIVAYSAVTLGVWVVYDYTNAYLSVESLAIGVLLLIGMIGVFLVLFAEAHEWAEAQWVDKYRRAFCPLPLPEDQLQKVSIHVPAYNEPPDMLIETLEALAKLDYPNYEVLVIDNNTKDPAIWQPVQEACERLGSRFRFFHVDPLAGFKAGALNFALQQTDPSAEIIAVIDADYIVDPMWLRDLTPQFAQPNVGIVQAPQDYRDEGDNAFKALCYCEYRGFFYIGMITRNERNAIIQHGTMTMVRHDMLKTIGWAQWCITEDAELGLRIFEEGYEAVYIPKSYGRGLMPDTFIDFKKQRFRWAYGAIQIMRRHMGELFGFKKTQLTRGQRYHFIAGWLPWLADGFNLLFTFSAIAWSIAMILEPKTVFPPPIIFAILPMLLFLFKTAKLLYLYRTRVRATVIQTLAAALAGLSLSHTIAIAMVNGFFTKNKPFFRTPKMAQNHALFRALLGAYQETILMAALWACALGVYLRPDADSIDMLLWIAFLVVQSIPYFSALAVSLISGMPKLSAKSIGRIDVPAEEVMLKTHNTLDSAIKTDEKL